MCCGDWRWRPTSYPQGCEEVRKVVFELGLVHSFLQNLLNTSYSSGTLLGARNNNDLGIYQAE